jgi:short-subunit dehydrogenase
MKTVLITGASSGIGKETAIYFAKKGWNVAATMRNIHSINVSEYKNIKKFTLDVNDENSIKVALEKTLATFGQIDVVVNNAGYAAAGAFECASNEQIKKQFDVNVFGLMNVTRAILPYFRKSNKGTIINVASVAGHAAFPTFTLYNATKYAVEGFSEALQYELKQFNIKVKIVEPGPIKTDFYNRSMDVLENPEILAYDSYINPAMKKMNDMGMRGLPPIAVSKTIFRAAVSQSYKQHYPVAFQAKALITFKNVIPDRVFRGIVQMAMK